MTNTIDGVYIKDSLPSKMTGRTHYKILSVVTSVLLLLNSLWGVFLYPQSILAQEPEESTKYIEFLEPVEGVYGGETNSLGLVVEAEYEPFGINWIMFRFAPPGETCQQQYTFPYFNEIGEAEHEEGTDIYTQIWSISELTSGEYTICALMHKNGESEGYVDENHAEVSVIIDNEAPQTPTGLHIIQNEIDLGCDSFINQRRITVDWDDNSGEDFDHYDYQIREERTIAQPTVSEYTGDIRDEDGYYKYRVRAVDTVGNASDWTDWCGVTLDRVPPSAPTIILPLHNSFLRTENLTKVDWTNVDDPSSPVTYQYQAFSDENYTVNRWGPSDWLGISEIPTPGTPEGVYYVRVRAKDTAGNISDWSNGEGNPHKITVDNTPPTIPGQMGWTTENPPEGEDYVEGSDFDNYKTCGQALNYSPMTNFWQPSTDNVGIFGYEREVYNPEETRIYSSTRDTNYEHGGGAIDGNTYWVMVRAFDEAGNYSDWTDKCSITYDESPPLTILTSPEDNTFWNNSIPIRGSSSDNVEIESVDISYQEIGDEDWSLIINLANDLEGLGFDWSYDWEPEDEEVYNIKSSAKDTAGNEEESAIAYFITFDISEPQVPDLISPFDGMELADISPTLTWEEPEDNLAGIKDYRVQADDQPDFTSLYRDYYTENTFYSPNLYEETWYWRVKARDNALNWSEWSEVWFFVVDTTPPQSFFISPEDEGIFGGPEEEPIEISGYSTDEPGETVDFTKIYYKPSDVGEEGWVLLETFDNEGGHEPFYWDYDEGWTPEEDGFYDFKAIATDKAGNVEETNYVYGVIYDTTNPELSWTSPIEDTIISGSIVILSVATDNLSGVESVTYLYQRDDGVDGWHEIATITESPYEAGWDTTGLVLDFYNLKAVVRDRAGNFVDSVRRVGVAAVISGEAWNRPEFGKITVSWTTDRPTSGRVVYDTTSHSIDPDHPNYGYANTSGVVDNSPKTTSHTVTLSGLLNGITYYWRTVSTGSPVVISKEHRGDTFSIPGPGGGGEGAVAGVATTTVATTGFFVSGVTDEDSVLGEEEEVLEEKTRETMDGFERVEESVLAGGKAIRVILWGGAVLGGLTLVYFFFRRRKKKL